MKPYYERDGIVLHHADCLEVLPTLAAGSVDAVVTDPPWGIGYRSGHNSSRLGNGAKMTRKDGNFACIHGDDKPFDPTPLLQFPRCVMWGGHYFYSRLPANGTWLIWDKLAGKSSFPSGSDCELAWCNWKGPTRLFTHLWRGIMRAGEENIANEPKLHPNQKPIALMAWTLEQCGGQTILDSYAGSCTTLVAAWRLGRKCTGVEISEEYCEIGARRLDKEISQGRLFAPEPVAMEQQQFSDTETP